MSLYMVHRGSGGLCFALKAFIDRVSKYMRGMGK